MIKFQRIETLDDLKSCRKLGLDHILWDSQVSIKTEAQCAYNQDGFVLKFIVHENNPLRRFKNDQAFVFKDSAVEFFISFGLPYYFNFEVNANGAILAEYGIKKAKPSDRAYLAQKDLNTVKRHVALADDHWSIILEIPFALFSEYQKEIDFNHFTFNLYKIAEDKNIEHYHSYGLVKSEHPNFHRPEDFVAGTLG